MKPNPPRTGLPILALVLLALIHLVARTATAQEDFLARFETDAAGTWLVYPSQPGWH